MLLLSASRPDFLANRNFTLVFEVRMYPPNASLFLETVFSYSLTIEIKCSQEGRNAIFPQDRAI